MYWRVGSTTQVSQPHETLQMKSWSYFIITFIFEFLIAIGGSFGAFDLALLTSDLN